MIERSVPPVIRPANSNDADAMAGLLNDIIRIGGTTAHTDPVDAKTLLKWMAAWPGRSNWHVAVAEDGALMGFQFAEPHPLLSADTADVATFVRVGATGRGIGSQLFAATRSATLALGYAAMVAVIRADNTGGLAYYRGRGFREIDRLRGVTLGNGLVVDKIVARFDLR